MRLSNIAQLPEKTQKLITQTQREQLSCRMARGLCLKMQDQGVYSTKRLPWDIKQTMVLFDIQGPYSCFQNNFGGEASKNI